MVILNFWNSNFHNTGFWNYSKTSKIQGVYSYTFEEEDFIVFLLLCIFKIYVRKNLKDFIVYFMPKDNLK